MSESLANRSKFKVQSFTIDDIDEISAFLQQSWRDTYVSLENNITPEMIDEMFEHDDTDEARATRKDKIRKRITNPDRYFSKIARDGNGRVVGLINGDKHDDNQEVRATYIDKSMHGTGLAYQMFDELEEWFDDAKPTFLWVTDYNNRAQSFYKKYGFTIVEGASKPFKEMPEMTIIKMERDPKEVA